MIDLLRFIDHPLVATLGWTLTHFVWQGAVVGLAAFFILRVVRPGQAATRYAVGVCALAAMLITPIATFMSTSGSTASQQRVLRQMPAAAGVANAGLVTGAIVANLEGNPGAVRQLLPPSGGTPRASDVAPIAPIWLPIVTAIWIGGVGLLSLRMLGGWLLTQRLARRAVSAVTEDVEAAAREMARRLRLRRAFAVLESAAVTVPTLVGWVRPVILLPTAALAGLTPMQLQAVIAHELAHIRRHDYLVNLLQTLVETLLFYHPAVWWVSSEIRAEREHCCDDLAVDVCGDRFVYVSALAELTAIERRAFALAATDGSLVARVRRILGRAGDSRRELPPSWGILVLLVLVGGGAGTYELSADAADVAQIARAAARATVWTASGDETPGVTEQTPSAPVEPVASQPVREPVREWSPFGSPEPPEPPAPPAPPLPPVALPRAPMAPIAPVEPLDARVLAPVAPPAPAQAASPAPPAVPVAPKASASTRGSKARELARDLAMVASARGGALSAGQQKSSGNFVWTHDNERLTVRWTGPFRLSDDERDIGWVEEGATLTIADGWVFTDRVEFRGLAGGQVERTYYRSGVKRDLDAAGREFLANTIQRMIRSGMFATERVERFLKQGGPDAVIAEVDRLKTDSSYVKRVYYSALLKQADLSAAQLAQLLDRIATTMTSDYEKGTLLGLALHEPNVTDQQRILVARAAAKMASDHEQRKVLSAVLDVPALSSPLVTAVLETLTGVASNHERSTVLLEIARKGGVTAETSAAFMASLGAMSSSHEQRKVLTMLSAAPAIAGVVAQDSIRVAAAMSSSHDKAEVLLQILAQRGVTADMASSFFAAVNSLGSSHDKYRVLTALLARGQLPEAIVPALLTAVKGISSSYERSRVLLALLKAHPITGSNRALFLEAAESIPSTHEQNQVLAALVRAERR
jgi:beta-lactamase regulating signal transducer with metallopeptidase domain